MNTLPESNPFTEAVGPTNQEIVATATRDLRRQQESLDRAANRLESYQPDLHIQTVIQSERIHNYPPLPPCCPIRPCYYQNISEEIPQQFQRIVRFHFYFLIAYWMHLFINAVGCLAWLIVVEEKGKFVSGFSFVVSIAYLFLLAPCSYVCWFRPLYMAFRSDSSLGFLRYFVFFLARIIAFVLDSLGFYYYGTVGWINGFNCFAVNRYYAGTFMLVIAIIFDVLALIGFILMARMVVMVMMLVVMTTTIVTTITCVELHGSPNVGLFDPQQKPIPSVHEAVNYIYRHTGASFGLAKEELGQRITSNQMGQETATGAARGATR